MKKSLMNQFKYRKELEKTFHNFLDRIEPLDILEEFENSKFIHKEMAKLGGDIDTNPNISLFDDEALLLINQTIRNLKRTVTRGMETWLIVKEEKK